MNREPFAVAAIQPFEPRNADENVEMQETAWELASEAAGRQARLIVLPEYFNVMGMLPRQAVAAIDDTGPQRSRAAEFCRDHGTWLLLPLIECRDGKRLNTAHLLEPSGNMAHTYDKTHLTICEKRDYGLTAGESITVVDTHLCRIGVMICYDVYFPEVARVLSLLDADLILFPSLQRSDTEERTMLLNRARANDSSCYLARSSYGQKRGCAWKHGMMSGGSCIVGPDGSVLANAGRHEGIAAAVIDPHTPWRRPPCGGEAPPQPVREFLDNDRRPELYAPIAEE